MGRILPISSARATNAALQHGVCLWSLPRHLMGMHQGKKRSNKHSHVGEDDDEEEKARERMLLVFTKIIPQGTCVMKHNPKSLYQRYAPACSSIAPCRRVVTL